MKRYRFSFMGLVALAIAGLIVWGAIAIVAPRWDSSFVTVDADVVRQSSHGTGKNRTDYLTVRFNTIEGRSVTTTMKDSADPGATTVRVRYEPTNPKNAVLDSTALPYIYALAILASSGFFFWLAYKASLHDERLELRRDVKAP